MDAESREAVFEVLRKKGIRPIKVVAGDGSKANGEIRGVRRRVVGIAAVLAAIIAAIATSLYNRASTPPLPGFEVEQTRRQIIGDAAIIDKGIATGWSDVFPDEGDRFFASFAIPGVKAGQRNTTIKEIDAALHRNVEVTVVDAAHLDGDIASVQEDLPFLRKSKAGQNMKQGCLSGSASMMLFLIDVCWLFRKYSFSRNRSGVLIGETR